VKSNNEKSSQQKAAQINGEGSISNDGRLKDNIGTKEPIVNGTENACVKIVNGDPKKDSDCDISNSINAYVVANGINSDSSDTKSIKPNGQHEMTAPIVCPIKVADKQTTDKKKENKKTKGVDKNSDAGKKNDIALNHNTENKKEDEIVKSSETETKTETDKMNGEVVNGDKARESTPSEDGDDKKRDPEVLFIQDMGFTVKIVSPGAEPLDIQVNCA
jgi:hypothetical protein